MAVGSWTKDGSYELLDADRDGFRETIRTTQTEISGADETIAAAVPTVHYREWIDNRYKLTARFPVIGRVTEDNLRIRSQPSLEGTVTGKVMTGEAVYLTDRSLLPETIGEMRSYWYQITNKNGLSGWSFGYYLDFPPEPDRIPSIEDFLASPN